MALLLIATLALVCSSWAMETEDNQKDIKLPGNIELKRNDKNLKANFWMKNYTIGFEFFMHCRIFHPWRKSSDSN